MIEVFVEVEAGSRDKRLYDEETLQYKETRRVLQSYPFPYGFVLGTRCEDGECVDCYILTSDRLEAGTVADCRPDPVQGEGSGALAGTSIEIDRYTIDRPVRRLLRAQRPCRLNGGSIE